MKLITLFFSIYAFIGVLAVVGQLQRSHAVKETTNNDLPYERYYQER